MQNEAITIKTDTELGEKILHCAGEWVVETLQDSDGAWHNGEQSIWLFRNLQGGVYFIEELHDGTYSVTEKSNDETIYDYLRTHEVPDHCHNFLEYCVYWEVVPMIMPPMGVGADDKYLIWVVYNFYAGAITNNRDHVLRENDREAPGEVMTFDTLEAAEDLINSLDHGTYYLANGEYSRPEYYVIEG